MRRISCTETEVCRKPLAFSLSMASPILALAACVRFGGRREANLNRKLWLACLSLGLLAFAMAFAACGDDDDATPTPAPTPDPAQVAEVEDILTRMLGTDPTSDTDLDYFFDHITPQGLKNFGYEDADACRAEAEDCIGEPSEVESFSGTTISGDSANTTATLDNGDVINIIAKREDDAWKLEGFAFSAEIPAGVITINVSAVDYGYDWDKSEVGNGNIAFAMKNDGAETHQMVVAKVEDNFDVEAVIAVADTVDENTLPPGVEEFVGFGYASPGTTSNTVFEAPLEPGKYVFMCFVPDEHGKPHISHGMYSEFEVE